MAARRDARFHRAIEAADLVTCDGVGLAWAGRILGQPLRAIIPGSELITRLSDSAGGAALRYFLLGGGPGVAPAAAQNLKIRHPRVIVVGTHGGSPRLEDLPEILAALHAAAPIDVLWVAYGSPAQELWIARHQSLLPTKLAIGVGGTFDFMAGVAMPPPLWAQRAGLIWLFRLLREPWRWRRQQVLPDAAGQASPQPARRKPQDYSLNSIGRLIDQRSVPGGSVGGRGVAVGSGPIVVDVAAGVGTTPPGPVTTSLPSMPRERWLPTEQ